ncbi:MAG: hypothetical protein KL787_02370 [Taibaiella sp.]|nr:hypothetical protein [Taibaiella sp.]
MKKILFALPLLFALSCGNADTESTTTSTAENHEGHNHDGHNHDGHGHEAEEVSYKTHDPVCKMKRDESWTIVSVYNEDTVKFCSEPCKTSFDKNPANYTAQK